MSTHTSVINAPQRKQTTLSTRTSKSEDRCLQSGIVLAMNIRISEYVWLMQESKQRKYMSASEMFTNGFGLVG